ncbi:hypothetical protein Taro_039619 [Colocasia esculenta]|uniref:UspA domain-containing protein n=1 Tax=Colocasia esculenta TaxID=4460 RepID=A0A843WQP3_COLES|nr:hypothetical protein [Colocasia esculenta]
MPPANHSRTLLQAFLANARTASVTAAYDDMNCNRKQKWRGACGAATMQPGGTLSAVAAAAAAAGGVPAADVREWVRVRAALRKSDESAHAVKWALQNYLRPGDAMVLLHVLSTSVLYGADWGAVDVLASAVGEGSGSDEEQQKLEDEFDAFTTTKAQDLARPLAETQIPFKIHIVKAHDMKERLCLEVERLGLSAVIMGSRVVGTSREEGQLGSVSDYCVHHCVCPVVVVRYPDEREGDEGAGGVPAAGVAGDGYEGKGALISDAVELHLVPKELSKACYARKYRVLDLSNPTRQALCLPTIPLDHVFLCRLGNSSTSSTY